MLYYFLVWFGTDIFSHLLYPLLNEVEGGGGGGGVYWFHLVSLSVCPSVCPSVCLWTESCQLYIFYNTRWIHFIFTYLIKQLQKVCSVLILFFFFQN